MAGGQMSGWEGATDTGKPEATHLHPTNLQQHFCNISVGSSVQGRAAGIISEVHICALANELPHERNVARHNGAQQPRFARAKRKKQQSIGGCKGG